MKKVENVNVAPSKKEYKIREHSLQFRSVQRDPVTDLGSKISVDLDSHGKQSPRKMASKLRSSPSLSQGIELSETKQLNKNNLDSRIQDIKHSSSKLTMAA